MLAKDAIYILLTENAGVAALAIGGVRAGILDQTTTYPAIAFRRISYQRVGRLQKRGHSGLAKYVFRFFATANLAAGGYDAAMNLHEAIRLCLDGYEGEVINSSASPAESLDIDGIFPEGSLFDFYDDPTQTYQVVSDFEVWGPELQPTD